MGAQSVYKLADAIAFAEGFYASGSNRPKRNNNPGNLSLDLGFPSVGMDGILVKFASLDDGWAALHKQISMMLNGTSQIYNADMTIADVASRYTATEQESWANNVAARLGVPVTTRISEI